MLRERLFQQESFSRICEDAQPRFIVAARVDSPAAPA